MAAARCKPYSRVHSLTAMNQCTRIAAPLSLSNGGMRRLTATPGCALIHAVTAVTAALLVGRAAGPDYVRAQAAAPSADKKNRAMENCPAAGPLNPAPRTVRALDRRVRLA